MASRPTTDAAPLDRRRISIPLSRAVWILLATVLSVACDNRPGPTKNPSVERAVVAEPAADGLQSPGELTADQEKEIRGLIEQLVFAEREAVEEPLSNPSLEIKTSLDDDDVENRDEGEDDAYRARFAACEQAFQRLKELKGAAFPLLVEHLKDKRQSIPFRNHVLGQSVGDACYWNIYFQLQDRPDDYSSYGYDRMGRDGQSHAKPYWGGTPFDETGGVAEWLDENKHLSYTEKQIKCLRWLLEKEKAIGACDAESYFENILPLEIRIAERRLEAGEKEASRELERLRLIRDEKRVAEIPREYLP